MSDVMMSHEISDLRWVTCDEWHEIETEMSDRHPETLFSYSSRQKDAGGWVKGTAEGVGKGPQ